MGQHPAEVDPPTAHQLQVVVDGVPAGKVDEKAIRSRLYDPQMPDPDLVIRTSGEYRISNFLLWELAYSELVFIGQGLDEPALTRLFDAALRSGGKAPLCPVPV